MLSELQLEEAASQLRSFQVESEAHLKCHVDILQKYGQLMEDYKRLRSDYEEERDSREKYKQLAKGQERNPFVLVLVDGDGMIFDDDLVSTGADGGTRAAQLLNDVVRKSLRTRGLEHCKVMVRVYANLAGLSKALSKSKLAGAEKVSNGISFCMSQQLIRPASHIWVSQSRGLILPSGSSRSASSEITALSNHNSSENMY